MKGLDFRERGEIARALSCSRSSGDGGGPLKLAVDSNQLAGALAALRANVGRALPLSAVDKEKC